MRERNFVLRTLLALCLIPIVSSCSKTKEDSKIVLDSESMQILADDPNMKLVHVVVNVRGPNMNLVNLVWSGKKGDEIVEDPPEYFEISVPSGPDRLIQYLGVYENDTDNLMQFYYADQRMSFGPGDVGVELIANAFGESTKEVTFKGQYLRADGTSPTGRVEWLIAPPGNKPPIYVDDEFIYGGWFRFMAFEGVPITYRMKATGEVLFDRFTGDFGPAGEKLLKLNFPNFYHGHMDQESVFQCTEAGRSGSTFYWGYFGPGSTGKVVQFDGNGGSQFASGGHGLFFQCDPQVPLDWTHLTPAGGESVTGCGGGVEICLEGARFESGIERAYNYGPFKSYNGSPTTGINFEGPLKVTRDLNSPNNITALEWQYLPGLGAAIKDIEIYTRPALGNSSNGHDDDGIEILGCSAFLTKQGYTKVRTVSGTTVSISENMEQFVGKDIALCPRFNVAGKIVPGMVAPRLFSDSVPTLSGLPGQVFSGMRYTNEPTPLVTVTDVAEFKYYLVFNDPSCPEVDSPQYTEGTPGDPFQVAHGSGQGLYYLCIASRNAGGQWSWPQPVAQWTFDEDAPVSPNISCTQDAMNSYISINYSLDFISNLADLASTVQVGFNTANFGPYNFLNSGEYTVTFSDPFNINIQVPLSNTSSLYSFKVVLDKATDYAGNQGFMENTENISCP